MSSFGIVFSVGESQGGGVFKLTERPPWLIYAIIGLFLVGGVGVFAHMSRVNEGKSVWERIIQTVLIFVFFGVIISLLNLFR